MPKQLKTRVQQFFDEIKIKAVDPNIDIKYRPGQQKMSVSFADALENNTIMIQEAGVGIGKTYAYLIPIFYLISEYKAKGEKLGPIIISTSSKTLQRQLKQDIELLKSILGITNVTHDIVYGMNNYACLKKIEEAIRYPSPKHSTAIETLKQIKAYMKIDKEYSFSEIAKKLDIQITDEIKELIKASNKELSTGCQGCCYYGNCFLPDQIRKKLRSDIIITNHANLAKWANPNAQDKDKRIIKSARAIVIDEAHNLEPFIRDSLQDVIQIKNLSFILDRLGYNTPGLQFDKEVILAYYKDYFKCLKRVARNSNSDLIDLTSFADRDYLPFDINDPELVKKTNDLIAINQKIIAKASRRRDFSTNKYLSKFQKYQNFLRDMIKPDSNYIYGIETHKIKTGKYEDFHVSLKRNPKKIDSQIRSIVKIDDRHTRTVLLTSATMQAINLIRDLGLEKYNFKKEEDIPSPYLEEGVGQAQAVFYPIKNVPEIPTKHSPKYGEYLQQLSLLISRQLDVTDGKTLILFTNKEDTKQVYDLVCKLRPDDHSLILQTNDEQEKQEFATNINSTLFSYGYWEGLNIPGESISQVIIPKLPFPVNTPILKYKASKYSNSDDAMQEVYIPEMETKLVQGFGRGIRKEDDKCAFIILDPRYEKYQEAVDSTITKYFELTKFVKNNGPVRRLVAPQKGKLTS